MEKNICNQRLLTFADYLEKVKTHPMQWLLNTVMVAVVEENVRYPYKVRYQAWVFEQLPMCFIDWDWTGRYCNPMWDESDISIGTATSVIDFFSLSLDEFSHLFDIDGFQHVDRFGGVELSPLSDGGDFARNMKELVAARNKKHS